MSEIVSLAPRAEIDQSVIGVIEDALAMAKAGDIRAVCISIVRQNRHTATLASQSDTLSSLIGAVHISATELTSVAIQNGAPLTVGGSDPDIVS